MKHFIPLLCLLVLHVFPADLIAQQATAEKVKSFRITDANSIVDRNNEVTGYYMWYWVDRKDKKSNAYILRILDNNANLVQDIPLSLPKTYYFLECAFNGEAFALLFFDRTKKSLVMQTLDKSGKRIKSHTFPKSKGQELNVMAARIKSDYFARMVYPTDQNGFILTRDVKNSKLGYSIEAYDNQMKRIWQYGSKKNSTMFEMAEVKYTSDKYIVLSIMKKPGLLSRDLVFDLIVVDASNGNEIMVKTMVDKEKFGVLGLEMDEEKDEMLVVGEYYGGSDKIFYDKSKGLFLMNIKMDGTTRVTTNSWVREIKKVVSVSDKGKVEDGGYIAFHKIIRTTDGSVFAIGEMFKKTVSGVGVAASIITRENQGLSNFKIMDMVVLKFDPEYNITSFETIEKRDRTVHLPPGWETVSVNLIATHFKIGGYFDYYFATTDKDRDRHFITYLSSDRSDGKKQTYIGAIIIDEGEYSTDRIETDRGATSLIVLPAKPGHVMIGEYYRKAKKLEARLEKYDF
jgi:hypothetical protein